MYNILCYGDSNTYGYNPANAGRYDEDTRWTRILARELGADFNILEEGCNGRTTNFSTPEEPWKNGMTTIKAILNTHKPLDLVILMLGTNDMKDIFHPEPEDIAENIAAYATIIRDFTTMKQESPAKLLIVSPILLGVHVHEGMFGRSFGKGTYEKSLKLAPLFEKVAKEQGAYYFNAATVAKPSELDQLHLDPASHKALGQALAAFVKQQIFETV